MLRLFSVLAFYLGLIMELWGAPAVAAPINGGFVYVGGSGSFDVEFQDPARIPIYLDGLQSLGIKNLTVVWTVVKPELSVCGDGRFEAVGGSWDPLLLRLQVLLDQAALRGMNVKLGLTESLIQCPNFFEGANVDQVAQWNSYLVWLFESRWRNHPALAGYYIPDEPSLAVSAYIPYTRRQVEVIRAYSTKDIVIAPYLGNASRYGYHPETVGAIAAEFVNGTGVTKLLYQDSVGGTMNLGRNPNEWTLESYFTGLRDAIGASRLESDLEMFSAGTYSSASIARVNFQAWEARSPALTSGITSWIPQSFMSTAAENAAVFPEARRLYTEYRALYGIAGNVVPFTYSFRQFASRTDIQMPSPSYPDRGTLNDFTVGDKANFFDTQWVGVLGTPYLRLDLHGVRDVDYVSTHVMSFGAAGIRFPRGVWLRFHDGVRWGSWAYHAAPAIRTSHVIDGEYVVSNLAPLHKSARYVEMMLPNAYWTFLSEITLVSGGR